MKSEYAKWIRQCLQRNRYAAGCHPLKPADRGPQTTAWATASGGPGNAVDVELLAISVEIVARFAASSYGQPCRPDHRRMGSTMLTKAVHFLTIMLEVLVAGVMWGTWVSLARTMTRYDSAIFLADGK